MASGNTLLVFVPNNAELPLTDFAAWDELNAQKVLAFDDSLNESAVFSGVMPRHYAGGGVTVRLFWCPESEDEDANSVRWSAAWERQADGGDAISSDSFATAIFVSASPTSSPSVLIYTDIVMTSGQMDGVVAGDKFRLKITRAGTSGGDTMADDARLVGIEVRET